MMPEDNTPQPPSNPTNRPADRPTDGQPIRFRTVDDSPEATYEHVEKVGDLLTELSRLLDGSLKCVEQAREAMSGKGVAPGMVRGFALGLGAAGQAAGLREVEQHLTSAAERLDKMASMADAGMRSRAVTMGSPMRARPITLGEALDHAAEVVTPLASQYAIKVTVTAGSTERAMPAGASYTVILNGLQNAVESVCRRLKKTGRMGEGGSVELRVRASEQPAGVGYGRDSRTWLTIEITDDGEGLPPKLSPSRPFDLGYTTKPEGSGVGLSVARGIVQSMGGSIELRPCEEHPGAVLRVCVPVNENRESKRGVA